MAKLDFKFIKDIKDTEYEVVEFHGELDRSTTQSAEQKLMDLAADFDRNFLIFDLSDLAFTNSEGIGLLISCHMKLAKKNQKLLICNIRPNVSEVFELIGLPKLVPTFSDVAQAVKFIKTK